MRTPRDQSAAGLEKAEVRFERLYAEHGRDVLAYAVRRVADAQDAADVVADTYGPRSLGSDWRIRRSCASAAGRSSRRAR